MRIPNPLGKKYVEAEENFCLSHCCNIFSIIYFIYYFMVFPYCRGFLYSRQDGVPWAVSYPPCLEGLRGQLPVLESQAGGNGCVFITSAPRLVWTVLNPVFVLALVLGLYVLALGRMPNLRRECGAWTWLFALSMFVSAGVTVYYVCLTRAGSMNYVWTGCLIVWFMNIYRTRWGSG